MKWMFLLFAFSLSAATDALYLSWYGDPTNTMTIQWHAAKNENLDLLELKAPSGELFLFKAKSVPFPSTGLEIYTLKLQNLEPDSTYEIKIGDEHYTFKTAPLTLEKPLRFVIGGDLYTRPEIFRKMAKKAASFDPLFAVLGGDLAYAIGSNFLRSTASRQWHNFLSDWKDTMVASGGRLIPFLVVPGNHDISENHKDLFLSLFAFPSEKLYRAIDFGSYLSLVLLDTGYLAPINGLQAEWLKKALDERSQIPYVIPVYHEGAYPSYYNPDGPKARLIRDHWCPLFDLHKIKAAFEHHGHTFKVTQPIKGNKADPAGTTYFGDGCWGVTPRTPNTRLWYIREAFAKNNFYLLELQPSEGVIKAIGLENDPPNAPFAAYPLPSRK